MRVALILAAFSALSSVHAAEPEFEAASIKPSPKPPYDSSQGPLFFGPKGGPGTTDPGRYNCTFCELTVLISQAYDIPVYRIFATPHLPEDRFHIVATMPAGTTRPQFRRMLQNLLVSRFKLEFHRETRPLQAYRMTVSPGGHKLQPHTETPPVATVDNQKSEPDKAKSRRPDYSYVVQGKSIAEFCRMVEGQLGKPVTDATGLTGTYDFNLGWTLNNPTVDASTSEDAPTLLSAIHSLGLKLESHKEPLEVLVVDNVTAAPGDN